MRAKGCLACGLALLMLLQMLCLLPSVGGDGIPGYVIGEEEDPVKVFSTLFESRQLARVDYLGAGQQRISLFLSVFSLDPGRNLTIMVPMRTLPTSVTGEPIKESHFRKEFKLERAEEEIVRQDPEVAREALSEETSSALTLCLGSLLVSYPAEYLRENVEREDYDGEGKFAEDSAGGNFAIRGEDLTVQHYDIDGFSIDVFDVASGPLLEEYLALKGLVIPEGGGLESYNSQYLAVIEAEAKPPIDEEAFDLLAIYTPNVIQEVLEQAREQPVIGDWTMRSLKNELYWRIDEDVRGMGLDQVTIRDLYDASEELVDAVFGRTDFEGEVIHVDLPLDHGNMFFPLGTSEGWPNEVGAIDVLFRVPEDKRLDIRDTRDAFFDGKHWYLFQMRNAKPGFDLESPVLSSDSGRLKEANRAAWVNDNAGSLGSLISAVVVIVLWFGCALAIQRFFRLEGKVVRDPRLWVLLLGSLVISIVGALLFYLLWKPEPLREAFRRLPVAGAVAMWPVVLWVLVIGGIL